MKSLIKVGAALALMSLPSAVQAQAEAGCVSRAEATALFAYVLPEVTTAIRDKCTASLPPSSFMASGSADLIGRFRANANGNWPLAKSAMLKMMGQDEPDSVRIMQAMPDEGLRALFNTAFTIGMTDMIKAKDCGTVDRFAQTLAPLPAPNMVELLILFFEMGSSQDKKSPIAICKA